MKYTTIYDVSNESVTYYWLIPLGFVIVGTLMWIFVKWYQLPNDFGEFGKLTNNISKKMAPVFYPIFIGLSALAFIILLISGMSNFNKTQEILTTKNYEIIEGKVENYDRWAPRGDQIKETFSVNDKVFMFEESDASYYGYRPDNKKQVIEEGMQLRISFYQNGSKSIVLKIEKGK